MSGKTCGGCRSWRLPPTAIAMGNCTAENGPYFKWMVGSAHEACGEHQPAHDEDPTTTGKAGEERT